MTHDPHAQRRALRTALKALTADCRWLLDKMDEGASHTVLAEARDELRESIEHVQELIGPEET